MSNTIETKNSSEQNIDFKSFRAENKVNKVSFLLTFEFVFILLVLVGWKNQNQSLMAVSLLCAIATIVLYLFIPKAFGHLVKLWTNLGLILHHVLQPLLVGALFLVVFTPMGLLMRIFGKNLLGIKRDKINSMWQKPSASSNFRDQF